MPGDPDATGPEPEAAPATDSGQPSSRPPRPEMSDSTPAPVLQPVVPNRLVKLSRSLWTVGFACGLIAILFAFVDRGEQLGRLRELITGLAPDRDVHTLSALALLVFWGTLGLLA